MRRFIGVVLVAASLAPVTVMSSTAASAASSATCASITRAVVQSAGFAGATGPVVTPYNYANVDKNSANALGTTLDFGSKALVVGCVSPADIAKLAASAKLAKSTSAKQYMAYMVQQSQGAMSATPVAGTTDYLDFGNGKEDGLGSTMNLGAVRLDAWVVNGYIFLGFCGPFSPAKPYSALLKFMKWTQTAF